jgi:hypothetical protein
MRAPYPGELRICVIEFVEDGASRREGLSRNIYGAIATSARENSLPMIQGPGSSVASKPSSNVSMSFAARSRSCLEISPRTPRECRSRKNFVGRFSACDLSSSSLHRLRSFGKIYLTKVSSATVPQGANERIHSNLRKRDGTGSAGTS